MVPVVPIVYQTVPIWRSVTLSPIAADVNVMVVFDPPFTLPLATETTCANAVVETMRRIRPLVAEVASVEEPSADPLVM